MKKKIAIMFTGQIRNNSLGENNTDNTILDSISKHLINAEFKENFDYDIFISTDKIDINKTVNYFGENLKNINFTEQNWYYSPISTEIEKYEYFYDKYLETIKNLPQYNNYIGPLYQNYRIYCCYKMVLDYEISNRIEYDYFIKIRLDVRLMQDFTQLLYIIINKQKKICMEHDHLIISEKDYKDIFNFINFIGSYQFTIDNTDGIFNYFFPPWTYDINSYNNLYFLCPERQLLDHIRMLINENNENLKNIFLGITYPSFQIIYRGPNNYGYSSYTDNEIFKPYHSIEYINSL